MRAEFFELAPAAVGKRKSRAASSDHAPKTARDPRFSTADSEPETNYSLSLSPAPAAKSGQARTLSSGIPRRRCGPAGAQPRAGTTLPSGPPATWWSAAPRVEHGRAQREPGMRRGFEVQRRLEPRQSSRSVELPQA